MPPLAGAFGYEELKQVCDEGEGEDFLEKVLSFPLKVLHPLPKTFALVYGRMK